MLFSLPFGNCKDQLAERKNKTNQNKTPNNPTKNPSMLSLDCVGEILAPLKSTEILTYLSTWKRLESKCDAPLGPSGKNLKMDGQPLTEPTKQNVQHHSNTSVEQEKKEKPCF